jgi:hypothetical protein
VERGEFDDLKQLSADLDKRYNQRILTWYANILFIEHTSGIENAEKEIHRLESTNGLSAIETRALNDIKAYFRDKGRVSTAGLLLRFYAGYLEAEYGHAAGAPLGALLELAGKDIPPGASTNSLK